MATPTAHIPVYAFQDLADGAKERARNWFRETYEFEPDYVIEDFSEICKRLGFSSIDLSYSGFWSQGDGASFTGTWYAEDFDRDAIVKHAPQDETLADIVATIATEVDVWADATATLERLSSRCVHESTVYVNSWENCSDESVKDLEGTFRRLMRWVYGQLRESYDAETSDVAVDEFFDNHDLYTFFEDGNYAPYSAIKE